MNIVYMSYFTSSGGSASKPSVSSYQKTFCILLHRLFI